MPSPWHLHLSLRGQGVTLKEAKVDGGLVHSTVSPTWIPTPFTSPVAPGVLAALSEHWNCNLQGYCGNKTKQMKCPGPQLVSEQLLL